MFEGEVEINVLSSSEKITDDTKLGAIKRKASELAGNIGLNGLSERLNPDMEVVFEEPIDPDSIIESDDLEIHIEPESDDSEINIEPENNDLEINIEQVRDDPRKKDRLPISTVLVGETDDRPEFEQVVFEPEVLDCVTVHLRSGAGSEMGGILIGHFCEEISTGKKFTKVEGFIPRRRATYNSIAIEFSSEDWGAMNLELDRMNDLSGTDQVVVGWVHSHPANTEVAPQSNSADGQRGAYGDRRIMRDHFTNTKFISMIYGIGGRYDNQFAIWRNFNGAAKRQKGFEVILPAESRKYFYYSNLSEL